MMQRKRNNYFIILLFFSVTVRAQHFRYTSGIGDVKKDGFYSIPVSPELSSYLKTDLSDIRIADEKGQWIPHITRWPLKNVVSENLLLDLPVLKKLSSPTSTMIVVNNQDKTGINNLLVELKNSLSNRNIAISGSDDQKNWFAIIDSLLITPELISDKPALKVLFPMVNYNYFKITIFNNNKDPYNVLKVASGITAASIDPAFRKVISKNNLLKNPGTKFSQRDSSGFSLIRIENPKNYQFNRIRIHVSSPYLFDRRAKLFVESPDETIHSLLYSQPVAEYILSSANTDDYETSWRKDSVFYLLIENRDNPPLKIDTIITSQISKELIAWLEKGKQYKLLFDDPVSSSPDYDLQKFRDRIPDSVTTLNIQAITPIADFASPVKSSEINRWRQWMWPVIIIALVLIGYFTFSLAKDVKKEK